MSETYDEANARMSGTLGARAEGSIKGVAAGSAEEAAAIADIAKNQREGDMDAIEPIGRKLVITGFRAEPPDSIIFDYDEAAGEVVVRLREKDSDGSADTPEEPSSGSFHPFQGIDASASGVAKVKFAYGTVGNASPTFGGNPVIPVSDEATVSDGDVVYLDAELDAAGAVTSLIATRAGSVPADGSTPGHYYRLLFTVTVSGGAVTAIGQSVTTNLYLFLCNGVAVWDRA